MSVTRISVDSGRMKGRQPNPIRVENEGKLYYGDTVKVGGGMFVNSPKARPYGATVWFETEEPVLMCVAPEDQDELEAAA
jgi:hypothetical protein